MNINHALCLERFTDAPIQLRALLPLVWISAGVETGDYQHRLGLYPKEQAVWEIPEQGSTNIGAEDHRELQRIGSYALLC